MQEFIHLDHRALMQFSFLIMLAMNIIVVGYYFSSRRTANTKYLIAGNISYMLFFFSVTVDIGLPMRVLPVVVAFFDLLAIVCWMMSIKRSLSLDPMRSLNVAMIMVNVVGVSLLMLVTPKVSLYRFFTSMVIVFVIGLTVWQLLRAGQLKDLGSSRFTSYMIIAFLLFKTLMTLYRLYATQFETSIESIELSINVLTFTSLIFAIWVNFSVAFLNYDLLNMEIMKKSLRDELTKLPNRRCVMETLRHAVEKFRLGKTNYALMIADVDDFKRVNDVYGHNIGDEVLVGLASIMEGCLRSSDFVGRYGGEEFLFLVECQSFEEAKPVFERLLHATNIAQLSEQALSLTMSGGVVMLSDVEGASKLSDITAIADKHLYDAKLKGKNQIIYGGISINGKAFY